MARQSNINAKSTRSYKEIIRYMKIHAESIVKSIQNIEDQRNDPDDYKEAIEEVIDSEDYIEIQEWAEALYLNFYGED